MKKKTNASKITNSIVRSPDASWCAHVVASLIIFGGMYLNIYPQFGLGPYRHSSPGIFTSIRLSTALFPPDERAYAKIWDITW